MGRFLYRTGKRIFNFLAFFLIIVLLPGLPPKVDFPFEKFVVTPPRELKGSLELNYHLENAERILDGRVYGPEHLIARKNEIFTGIHGGEVIKITADYITHVAKFGQPCEDIYQEEKCGRPLGMAFDTLGDNLIVADAYYGIWQVDIKNGKKKLLISPHQVFDGKVKRKAKLFNSVAVDKQGDIYWTDSSSDFTLEDVVYALFTNPSGRLFHYDRVKNVSKLLIDELYFANGVALSPNEDFVIVSETGASRIMKYHLKGAKKGLREVFLDGLPGNPDNLAVDSDGIWVPLVTACDSENPSIFQVLAPFPWIRTFILRFLALLELPARLINNAFPNKYAQKMLHTLGHFEAGAAIVPKRTTILRVDWNGNIIGSLHGFDKSVRFVSHVLTLEDSLLLGSPINKYIARVKIPRGPQVKIRNVRYEGIEPIIPEAQKVDSKPQEKTKPAPSKKTSTTTTTTTTEKPPTKTKKPTTTTTTTPKPTTTTQAPPSKKPTAAPKAEKVTTPKTTPPPPPNTPYIPSKPQPTKAPPKREPAPIKEDIPTDTKPPKQEKLKIIKKGGEHSEL